MTPTDTSQPVEILASRVLLHPRDFDRSLVFYRDVLGLHPMREFGRGAGRGIVFFIGGGFLELVGQSGEGPSGATELWLQVRDVAAEEKRLDAAGVTIVESAVKKPWGLVELRVQDPDGLGLVLVEIPPEHPLRRDARSLPATE